MQETELPVVQDCRQSCLSTFGNKLNEYAIGVYGGLDMCINAARIFKLGVTLAK